MTRYENHHERMVAVANFIRATFPNHIDFVIIVHDYEHGRPPMAVDNYTSNEAVKLLLSDVIKTYDQSAVESFRVNDDGSVSELPPRPHSMPADEIPQEN